MQTRNVIVIGGSSGALSALQRLLQPLPAGFPAAILIVIHTAPDNPGVLPLVLERAGQLPAEHASDRAPIRHGRIYVAPPDHHLLVKRGELRVTRGPRENRFRPAIDPLFRTAAAAYGARVIGGMGDGTRCGSAPTKASTTGSTGRSSQRSTSMR